MKHENKGKRVFVVIIAASIFSMLVFFGLSTLMARVETKDDAYEGLKVFSEAISYIRSNYVDDVASKELVYGAIKGMLKDLDPHSSFMTPEMYKEMQVDTKGHFEGIGIEITIKDDQLIVVSPIEGTPAFKAGLKAGDFILKINDVHTKDMSLSEAANRIRGPKGTEVVLTIWREGLEKPKNYSIIRGVVKIASVSSKVIEEGTIGYIRLRQFQENSAKDVANALAEMKLGEMKGLILDIRFNAGGLLNVAVDVADIFLDKDLVIVSTKGKVKEQSMIFKSRDDSVVPDFPIVVLVNAGSASASEILAGALKDWKRAVILGTKTFGKGSVQTIYPLEDGSAIRLTTAKYYTPKGTSIHGEGITPDIVVENLIAKDKKRILSEEHAIREKDLIEMEKSSKTPPPQEKENDKKEPENGKGEKDEKGENGEKSEEVEGIGYIEDIQLQSAIDIIKATNIFESSRESSSTKNDTEK